VCHARRSAYPFRRRAASDGAVGHQLLAVRAQALVEIAIVVVASLLARAAYDGMHSIQSDDFAIGLLAGCVFVLIARRQGLSGSVAYFPLCGTPSDFSHP